MSVHIDVSIDVNNVDQIKQALGEQVAAALEAIGLQAESYAKLKCPVDTGNLRNSITHEPEGDDTEVIGTNVEYAAYVELGTSKMAAQPYLEPAVMDHVDEYRSIAEEFLQKG